MSFINKGNFTNAQEELSNDKNNAVIEVYQNLNPKPGPLANVVFTLKDVFATED
jgi:aspartyl-tRNA(Asn)/glutamyl-tRNA(Gln) amidotransferase subunit A